jgi:predicted transcriptional regulator
LFINAGIKDISEILSNLRNLGRVIKSSLKKQQTFEETAKALKLNPLVLKRDTYIRWNSKYEMIGRGIKMKSHTNYV